MGLSKKDYETAKRNGISKNLAFQRYEYLFWDVERAVTEKPGSKIVEWHEWADVAKTFGISYTIFMRRRKKGMTPLESATKPKGKAGRPRKEGRT